MKTSTPRGKVSDGYDLPPHAKMLDFEVWEEVGPPKATVFNAPPRPSSGQIPSLTGSEASPDIAVER